jgi:hypothetical protein
MPLVLLDLKIKRLMLLHKNKRENIAGMFQLCDFQQQLRNIQYANILGHMLHYVRLIYPVEVSVVQVLLIYFG